MARVSSEAARHIGRKIKKLRESKKWSQDELGTHCGIDSANIRSYEAGRSMMNIQSLVRIATALDTTPGDLLTGLTADMFPQRNGVDVRYGPESSEEHGDAQPRAEAHNTQ